MLKLTSVALLAALGAYALDVSKLQPQGYVSDFANKIDPASRGQLERYAKDLEDRAGVQLAFVTLPSLEGEPIENVANDLFRKWGIGSKKSNEGVLLLLAIQERRSRLELGYGIEPNISDGLAGSVLRSMRPALKEAHYGDAMVLAANQIGSRVLAAKNLTADSPVPSRVRQPSFVENIQDYLPLILFLLLFLWVISRTFRGPPTRGGHRGGGSGILPWLILDQMGKGRGWGGTSHGGFGGYGDSGGGGFGGFGGGDSGGGGASSDW
ncbi:MAG: TPM domain-containing protein [Bryobacteraceae bacterium]